MEYVQPLYSHYHENGDVLDLAGDALLEMGDALAYFDSDMFLVLDVVNNWRASHQYPLNTFLQTLRNRAQSIEPKVEVTSRIKRRPAIEAKLNDRPDIKLSNMQDIGGCRAVFNSVESVYQLVNKYKNSNFLHELEREQDYIELPRRTGYRSYHLVYQHYSRRWPIYDGMRIEIQVRSQLQHLWATAVETADAALGGRLKSGQGDLRWFRFFLLMSSAIASREGRPRVPDAPRKSAALITELRALSQDLAAVTMLRYFGRSIQVIGHLRVSGSRYVVLVLDPPNNTITLQTYAAHEAERASKAYDEQEKNKPIGGDVLLVRASDANAVRRGYRSFFRDTYEFVKLVEEVLS
jgi:ppGpp synthetase/RelA/SpoT-type nucleotidyltranferase